MRAKLIAIVLMLTVTSITLLTVRQQRVQAVSDMATAIERAAALDRQLWRVRVEIGRRISPAELHDRLATLGPMEPILLDRHRLRWFTLEDSFPVIEPEAPPIVQIDLPHSDLLLDDNRGDE